MPKSVSELLLLAAMRFRAPLFAFIIGAVPLAAQSPSVTSYASVRGTVTDSVRGGLLAGATVELLPTSRFTTTNDRGEFRFDSIGANDGYQIRVLHPMLDTVGIALTTQKFALAAGLERELNVGVPSPARLVSMFCPPEQIARGPSALVGFVRDPDTGAAIDSATVSLVYDDSPIGLIKRPVNRIARLDAAGRYKICGLPTQVNGRVQLIRNGTQSGDIPVATDANSPLALRALGMSLSTQHVVTGKDSVGNAIRILKGNGKLNGRVLTKSGAPVAGAHVQMDATTAAAVSGPDGRFTLDGLPTGTQTVSVRKLGYTVTDQAVEVMAGAPATVSLVMENYIPTLAAVVTVGQRDKDMERIGYTQRKRQGMGVYRDGDQLPRGLTVLGDALSTIPGLKVVHLNTGSGTRNVITGANGVNSCLTFVVDGAAWKDLDGSSNIEDFVRPDELEAVELYAASTVPMQFVVPGQSGCQVLVLWTNRKIKAGTSKFGKPPT